MKDNIKKLLHEYSKIPMWENNEKREDFWRFIIFITLMISAMTITMSITYIMCMNFSTRVDYTIMIVSPFFAIPLIALTFGLRLNDFIYDKYFEIKSNKKIKKRMEDIEDQLRGKTYSGSLKILNDEFIISGHGYSLDSIKDIITKHNGLPFVYILKGIDAYKRKNAEKEKIDSIRENKIALLNADTITKRNNDFLKNR